jgi:hypothetical protein
MYCSTCGVAVAAGLSYCNYCGAKLSAAIDESASKPPDVKPELLVSAISGLFILGLVAIIMLMFIMKEALDLPVDRVLAFSLLPFLVLLFIEGVFIRLLLRSKRGPQKAGDILRSREHATNELDAARVRSLPEHTPSVTEHTTRAFDPIHIDRTSK